MTLLFIDLVISKRSRYVIYRAFWSIRLSSIAVTIEFDQKKCQTDICYVFVVNGLILWNHRKITTLKANKEFTVGVNHPES